MRERMIVDIPLKLSNRHSRVFVRSEGGQVTVLQVARRYALRSAFVF